MVVSISDVLGRIKNVLNQTMNLNGIWIQGEISNLTKHRSGHYYFSLKDKSGEMSCVMFSSYVSRLNFDVEEGANVLVSGSINIYESRGQLQLIIRSMKLAGIGDLYQEFEKRKMELEKAGYFDESHKKKKPDYIEKIAVITAKEGAALQDVKTTIQKRWPMMKIHLYASYVQGNLAAQSIVSSLKKADLVGYDAILLVRGGGSFEDLFCFNDVELVKTIYSAKTYIVSGVGHETDTTLCDLVSDHRSVTPTAAAQWVSLDQYDVLQNIKSFQNTLIYRISSILDINKNQYIQYCRNPYLQDPKNWIIEKKLRLDTYYQKLESTKNSYIQKVEVLKEVQNKLVLSAKNQIKTYESKMNLLNKDLESMMKNKISENKNQFYKYCALLDAYSPLKVLKRGYTVTYNNDTIVHSISGLRIGDTLTTKLSDGQITSEIINVKEDSCGK